MSERLDPGPAIDLDKEDVRDGNGRRITNKRAAQMADEATANAPKRPAGRPSLTGSGTRSPQVAVRFPAGMHAELAEKAEALGVTVSTLVREITDMALHAGGAIRKQMSKLEDQLKVKS